MPLKKRLGISTAWMSIAGSGNSAISFIIFIILSRILAPAEIGLVAFALIFVELGKIIVNAGFPQAIVQHQVWDETYASTCFYLNLVFALIVALVVLLIGAPLATHYYQPGAGPILQALSVIFFIEGLKAVHEGKLKRDFKFRAIAIRSMIGGLVSGAVGIYLAINGYGVWALVWQQLINHTVISIFTIFSARWLPGWRFSIAYLKELMKFSSPLMIAQAVGNISSTIFDLLVGIILGPAALGFFRVGGRVLFILQDITLKPFEHTTLSALSRISEGLPQAFATVRLIRISAFLIFPIFFGAAAVGPEFIVFAFGDKWALSGSLLTIMGVGLVPLVIGYQINAALTASGHSRLVMHMAGIAFAINCSIAVIAVPYGLLAAAYGFAARTYLTIFFNLYFFKKVFGMNMLYLLRTVAPTFLSSAAMFTGVIAIKPMLLTQLSASTSLIAACGIGALIYILFMVIIFRAETRNFFVESADLLPATFRPVIVSIQRLIKLN